MTSLAEDAGGNEPRWRRSSRCGNSACVEVASLGDEVAVRDSKNHGGPVLTYSREEWRDFVAGVKDGEFDLP